MMYVYNTYLGISSPPQFPDGPLGLHLAAVGKTNGHQGQGVALEDAQVAAEDVRRGWQRHVMYQ